MLPFVQVELDVISLPTLFQGAPLISFFSKQLADFPQS